MKKLFISQPMSGKADEEILGGNQSGRRVVERTCRGY